MRDRGCSRWIATVAMLAAALVSAPGAAAAQPPQVGGCELFPAYTGPAGGRSAANLTAWNQRVSSSPRDRRSGRYMRAIRRLGGNQALHPDFGGNGGYGIPFVTVPSGQPIVQVTVDAWPEESDFGPAPIPPSAPIEGGSDRHVLVLRQGGCDLYEMYRAFPGPGSNWHADSTARWSLHSAALRRLGDTRRTPPASRSSRGSSATPK